LGDISERDYDLRKAKTNDKSKLPSKEELQAQIQAEKSAPQDESS